MERFERIKLGRMMGGDHLIIWYRRNTKFGTLPCPSQTFLKSTAAAFSTLHFWLILAFAFVLIIRGNDGIALW
jgi:hypothetical protein